MAKTTTAFFHPYFLFSSKLLEEGLGTTDLQSEAATVPDDCSELLHASWGPPQLLPWIAAAASASNITS